MPIKIFLNQFTFIAAISLFACNLFAQGEYILDKGNKCKCFTYLSSKSNRTFNYTGSCKDGYVSGKATVTFYVDNEKWVVFSGNFDRGFLSGIGTIEFTDAYKYEGEIAESDFNGKGKITDSRTGDIIEGIFKGSEVIGNVKITYSNGERYNGPVKNNWVSYFGNGTFYFKNGDYFTGNFNYFNSNDVEADNGNLHYKDGRTVYGMLKKAGGRIVFVATTPEKTLVANIKITYQNQNENKNENTKSGDKALIKFSSIEEAKAYLKANFFEGYTNYKANSFNLKKPVKWVYLKSCILFIIPKGKLTNNTYPTLFWDETGFLKLQNNALGSPSIFWTMGQYDFREESYYLYPQDLNGPVFKVQENMNSQVVENINNAFKFLKENYQDKEQDLIDDDETANQIAENEEKSFVKIVKKEDNNDWLKSHFGSVTEARDYLKENFTKGYTLDLKYYFTVTYADEKFTIEFDHYDNESRKLGSWKGSYYLWWRDVKSCYLQTYDPVLKKITGSTNTKFYFSITKTQGHWSEISNNESVVLLYYTRGEEKKYEKIANALRYMAAFYK